jgi:anthranilate phosphoribosyltransferase
LIQDAIKKLVENKSISETEAYASMSEIMMGAVSESVMAAYLIALRMKGESVDEITGSVKAMMEAAVRIR